MKPALSVFIMAYNESGSIENTVREIHGGLTGMGELFELVIIDDGSSDGTSEKADSLAESLPLTRVVHHRQNLGLGGVYRRGFSEAKGEFATFFPADGQFPAEIIGKFRPFMEEYDMVLGYLPNRKGPVIVKGLSAIERALYTVLFGRLPRFQGIMMFRVGMLEKLKLSSSGRGWAVVMELIIRAARAGYRIRSEATGFRQRAVGKSKVNNIKNIWSNFIQVVALRRYI